jgi:hypothetical protein
MSLYADGSKDGEAVAATAVSSYGTLVKRLPDHSSVFSAEARAGSGHRKAIKE